LPYRPVINDRKISALHLAIITIPIIEFTMLIISDIKVFTQQIINGTGLQIVRFCTEWSGPCQIMAPIYREMYNRYKQSASFYRIDVDKSPLLKKEFGIVELPSILFYKNGNVIDHAVGMISRDVLIEKMEKQLN
jgi:thioredoxin 1